jgi:hypothetical protein
VRLKDWSQLIPAEQTWSGNSSWQINAGTDELILEIFQESAVESGLLEAIVLSVVLLRSGYSLGDAQERFVFNSLYTPTLGVRS